jgi:hypothetical protein
MAQVPSPPVAQQAHPGSPWKTLAPTDPPPGCFAAAPLHFLSQNHQVPHLSLARPEPLTPSSSRPARDPDLRSSLPRSRPRPHELRPRAASHLTPATARFLPSPSSAPPAPRPPPSRRQGSDAVVPSVLDPTFVALDLAGHLL